MLPNNSKDHAQMREPVCQVLYIGGLTQASPNHKATKPVIKDRSCGFLSGTAWLLQVADASTQQIGGSQNDRSPIVGILLASIYTPTKRGSTILRLLLGAPPKIKNCHLGFPIAPQKRGGGKKRAYRYSHTKGNSPTKSLGH